ncbi:hypothetical protein B551_0205370 [Cupriavidus sp. HPC(L)]|nr:hypothetical protein B551_0205370 [Cupriavidus sp. HPC(L)]
MRCDGRRQSTFENSNEGIADMVLMAGRPRDGIPYNRFTASNNQRRARAMQSDP